jgi:hypothetical protein
MRRQRKVLVRPITFEQARSYERARPNGLGVTAIAAVNGRGSYARRYARARRLLGGLSEEQQMVKRGRARRYGRNPFVSTGPATSRWVSDKDYPRAVAAQKKKASKARASAKRAAAAQKRAALIAAGKKPRRKPVSAARARMSRLSRARKVSSRKPRVYGGKYRAVRAKVGPYMVRDTFAYATKRGTLKKIPRYALLGFRSLAEMKRMTGKDAALKERIDKRVSAFDKRRAGTAARIGGLFAPNRRRKPRVISFATWESQMKLGRGRRKAKSYSANKGRKVRRGRKVTKRHTAKRRTLKRSKVARRRPVIARRRRVVRRRPVTTRRRYSANKSLKTMKRVYRKPRKVKRVSLRLYSRNAETAAATLTPNRRRRRSRRSRRYAANASRRPTISLSRKFKRARKVKGFKFRGYSRNASFMKNASVFKDQIMEALVVGSVAGAGFLAHRALTRLVTYKAPWFKDQMAKDALNPVPEMIAAAGVALIGVPLVAKFFPGKAKVLAAGMIADFLVLGVQKLLTKYDSKMTALPYFAGMGSYYELPARRGYGEYVGGGQMTQAQAGFGRLTQAAAGMGRFQQAAAGFGRLTQAAAGVGEYVATDLEGIGDYIEVTPELTAAAETDNGIMPTLSEAEAALNVSEGANGIGGRVPARYTVDPTDQTAPLVEDENVDRAGMFAGRDGIFGPLQ